MNQSKAVSYLLVICYFSLLIVGCKNKIKAVEQSEMLTPENIALLRQSDTSSIANKVKRNIAVPVLSYHQIRDHNHNDSRNARVYIVTVEAFKAQMKMLHEKDYHTILPDDLLDYNRKRKPLPLNPIILTFDDGTISEYQNALPELEKYGYKAVFFIMTVTLNKSGYLNEKQISELAKKGHIIGCHTWDHHKVTDYKTEKDWQLQLEAPLAKLQELAGYPIRCFAYPYGVYSRDAAERLKSYRIETAFQLEGKPDPAYPLLSIPRILVSGYWNNKQLSDAIEKTNHYNKQ